MKKKPTLVEVELRKGESQESLLKRFSRKAKKEGIIDYIRKKGTKRRHMSNTARRIMKQKEAEKRRKKELSRRRK